MLKTYLDTDQVIFKGIIAVKMHFFLIFKKFSVKF